MSDTVYTEDPFSYNFVAMKKSKVNDLALPGRDQVVATPESNAVGKALGVKDKTDWKENYDKVFLITEWAKERSGLKDPQELVEWISKNSKKAFKFGSKRIDSLYDKIRSMKDGQRS